MASAKLALCCKVLSFNLTHYPPFSGGLAGPHELVFALGKLYVTSHLNNSVLRYDGVTGAFVDAVVPSGFGGLLRPTYIAFTPRTLQLTIDIKPGSDPNSINLGSRGSIPVAILSTATFDSPRRLDLWSLTFGRTGDEASLAFCNPSGEDVNGDGLLDQVCHFRTEATGFQPGDPVGVLKGRTTTCVAASGTDAVRVLP